jgi:RNA polymerase sigma factor (sigma-70 family)
MVAMVLGTALAAMTPAARAGQEASPGAINDISRYCTACWRNARLPVDRWGDCTQEVFERLLQRVPGTRWPQVFSPDGLERQEFLRAIDTVKKRVQRDRQRLAPVQTDVVDRRVAQDQDLRETREQLQQAIQQSLSRRQQRILKRTSEGWSVADIAGELGLSAARVSDEKYKAIHKLRARLEAI